MEGTSFHVGVFFLFLNRENVRSSRTGKMSGLPEPGKYSTFLTFLLSGTG